MRKEWILSDEEKCLKRRKIEQNRVIKQNAQLVPHQTKTDMAHVGLTAHIESNEVSLLEKRGSWLLRPDLLTSIREKCTVVCRMRVCCH